MRSVDYVRARASERIQSTRERIALQIERAPSLSLGLILAVVWLMSIAATSWWAKSARDQVWRARLIESSASLRRVVTETNTAAALSDERLVATIGDLDARLLDAERALKSISVTPGPGGACDGVPGDTPGLRQGNRHR